MKFLLVAALFVCIAADPVVEKKSCSGYPIIVSHDARKTCQPFAYNMYISNIPTDQCIQLIYYGNRNGDANKATALFQMANDNYSYPMMVDISNGKDEWNTTDDQGKKVVYHKLFMNQEDHYFCLFSCDNTDDTIEYLRCMALDHNGHLSIKEKLLTEYSDLPFKTGEGYSDVYTCDDRAGGLRQYSGNKDPKPACY